ncbi:MAG: hypothetical protein H6737_09355 [Alphaproteobacteria bacterium]|nr:hypothetical protein [Alphaproteobacteria bacterium]
MDDTLPWAWWRDSEAGPDGLAAVLADWMEQRGDLTWARWFRDPAASSERILQFYGPDAPGPAPDAMSWRVLVGSEPVVTPLTRCDGPWFETVHVVLDDDPDLPDLGELGDVPCMARLRHLVVHRHAMRPDVAPVPRARPFRFADAAALGRTLHGLWLLDAPEGPDDLCDLPHLTHLQCRIGPGTWRHPRVHTLHTWGAADVGTLDLPALRFLDIEDDGPSAWPFLTHARNVEVLEIDARYGEEVVRAQRDGLLPALRRLRVWGEAPHPPDVAVEVAAPWSRESIRRTSDWRLDRALRMRPGTLRNPVG